jgi:hypothetical protein
LEFFSALKKYISRKASLPNRPTSQYVGTIFARKETAIIYIYLSLQKLQKLKSKINQIIGRVGFEGFSVSFGVSLEWLFSFSHFCKKSDIITVAF